MFNSTLHFKFKKSVGKTIGCSNLSDKNENCFEMHYLKEETSGIALISKFKDV